MKHDEYVHLIDVNEFRNKILEYEFSEDFDKMYNSTVFSEYSDDRYKNAIRYGLVLSSLLISQCESLVAIKVEKENIFENNTEIKNAPKEDTAGFINMESQRNVDTLNKPKKVILERKNIKNICKKS